MTSADTTSTPAVPTVETVIDLYDTHLDAVRAARSEQRALLAARGLRAQLDDIEGELTYLWVRHTRPATVVEIGALHGWSSAWILRALRDNGEGGRLLTMDLTGDATFAVPTSLSAGRWEFREGDARTLPRDWLGSAGYLFVDAAHTARFARWYLAEVFPHLAPGTPVSVHDVFHRRRPPPLSEGAVLLRWLRRRGGGYFTASRAAAPRVYNRIQQFRRRAALAEPIRDGTRNPMVFLEGGGTTTAGRAG